LNSNQTEALRFITYHSHPNALSNSDLNTINQWIAKYPYCQSLHYLAARSAIDTSAYPVLLAQAAAISPSRSILHSIIYQPDQFISDISSILEDDLVSSSETIVESEIQMEGQSNEDQNIEAEHHQNPFGIDLNQIYGSELKEEIEEIEISPLSITEEIVLEVSEIELAKEDLLIPVEEELVDQVEVPLSGTEITEEETQEDSQIESEVVVELAVLENATEEEFVEVVEELSTNSDIEEEDIVEEVEDDLEGITSEALIDNPIEDEELVEVVQEPSLVAEIVVEEIVEDETQKIISLEEKIEKEEFELVYPIQTDFFALNRKTPPEKEEEIKDDQSLSQYNDERMPYTFLWWLNKTRKEHSANVQPYTSFKLDTTSSIQVREEETAHLNQQIAENIFHLRGAEDLSVTTPNFTVPFDFRKKEFQIIEKFIKEEPQIKPPAANKIDSENKAKRSSVDTNLVVSETLAKIYVEQMLYHKALEAYKKLSLKYPEKSTYFASQIKYLELKVN
jgi:hypothetical protein